MKKSIRGKFSNKKREMLLEKQQALVMLRPIIECRISIIKVMKRIKIKRINNQLERLKTWLEETTTTLKVAISINQKYNHSHHSHNHNRW